MAQDGKFFPFSEEYFARIVVVIAGFKPHSFREGQKGLQALRRALAEGHALFGRGERAVKADYLLQGTHNFIQVFLHEQLLFSWKDKKSGGTFEKSRKYSIHFFGNMVK